MISLHARKGDHTDKKTDGTKTIEEDHPVSRRKSETDGARFLVIRHFVGEKDLHALMSELAEAQANREMGL